MSENNQVNNEIYTKDFKVNDSFKERFSKEMTNYSVTIDIKDTDLFIKTYKNNIFKYKNFSPIIKQTKDKQIENRIVTKYSHSQTEDYNSFVETVSKDNKVNLISHNDLFSFKLSYKNFSIEEIISKLLGEEHAKSFPKSFEVIGNIAHMNIRDEYLKYKYLIGGLILDVSHYFI